MDYAAKKRHLAGLMRTANYSKADGSAAFVSDGHREGMLYGRIVRAPHPRCRILNIETAEAAAYPGVHAVVTADDIEGIRWFGRGPEQDQQILAQRETYSLYDAVALIAADSREIARRAADLIRITAEPLPAVYDAEAALAPEAPILHGAGNLLQEYHYVRGAWEEAAENAAVVVSETFSIQPIEHAYLETDCALAFPDEEGRMHVEVGCHNVMKERQMAAAVLGVEEDRIRVTQPYTGGSFGGKDDGVFTAYAVLLAKASGRPVLLQVERDDEFCAHTKRHPQHITMSMAFDGDGGIRGMRCDILADTGSAAHVGSAIFRFVSVNATGPYRMANVDVHTKIVYTNQVAFGAMRSWGMTGLTFAVETLLNMAAEKLALHPLSLRERNAVRDGDHLLCGSPVPPGARYLDCIDRMRRLDVESPRQAGGTPGRCRRGVGFAGCFQGSNLHFGHHDQSDCRLLAFPDGKISIEIAASDIGQGLEAALIAIVSEALGNYPPEKIRFERPCGEYPSGGSTGASRQLTMSGNATLNACENLIAFAADFLSKEKGAANVQFRDGFFRLGEDLACSPEAVFALFDHPVAVSGRFTGVPTTAPDENGYGFPVNQYGYGVQRAEVEVDLLTGQVRLLSLAAVHDGGRILNPTGAEGQIQGAMAQGAGMALMEDCRFRDGRPLQRGYTDYLIPTAADLPEIGVEFIDKPVEMGRLGVKGLAEVGITPTAPAIIAAIHDAAGIWITSLPANPPKVLSALMEAGK